MFRKASVNDQRRVLSLLATWRYNFVTPQCQQVKMRWVASTSTSSASRSTYATYRAKVSWNGAKRCQQSLERVLWIHHVPARAMLLNSRPVPIRHVNFRHRREYELGSAFNKGQCRMV